MEYYYINIKGVQYINIISSQTQIKLSRDVIFYKWFQ